MRRASGPTPLGVGPLALRLQIARTPFSHIFGYVLAPRAMATVDQETTILSFIPFRGKTLCAGKIPQVFQA